MSTSVTFTSNLTAEPELRHSRDGQPVAGYCGPIGRCIEVELGEWVDGELTGQSVTTASAERVVLNSRLCNLAWRRGETGEKRAEQGVSVVPTVTIEN
jgi:single-stranded DNA-binding protein